MHTIPQEYTVIGSDEDTAPLHVSGHEDNALASRWRVMGQQGVTVFSQDAPPHVFARDLYGRDL